MQSCVEKKQNKIQVILITDNMNTEYVSEKFERIP